MNLEINIFVVGGILASHYVADFILQTDNQAKNKSKCNIALYSHVETYSISLIPIALIILGWPGLLWVVLNGLLHFGTDYITSRINSKLWAEKRWHDFFVSVGADQLCHYITLFGTYLIFKNLS